MITMEFPCILCRRDCLQIKYTVWISVYSQRQKKTGNYSGALVYDGYDASMCLRQQGTVAGSILEDTSTMHSQKPQRCIGVKSSWNLEILSCVTWSRSRFTSIWTWESSINIIKNTKINCWRFLCIAWNLYSQWRRCAIYIQLARRNIEWNIWAIR